MTKDAGNDIDTTLLRQGFDESVDSLDARTASRIVQARYRVIESRNRKYPLQFVLPAGAIATAFLAVMVYLLVPEPVEENGLMPIDVELISSSDELELYEDLEFYEWLDSYEVTVKS